jgi:hypothetical protein
MFLFPNRLAFKRISPRRLALHNSFRLAFERIKAQFAIGHDWDEHGQDRNCSFLGARYLGSRPFVRGLPDDPLAPPASRLDQLQDDPTDDKATRAWLDDCNQVVHFIHICRIELLVGIGSKQSRQAEYDRLTASLVWARTGDNCPVRSAVCCLRPGAMRVAN